jgi:hypothetical protein
MSRLMIEGLIIVTFGILLLFLILFILFVYPRFGGWLAGWRFGLLSFILSAIVVLSIELIGAIAHATSEFAETIAARFTRPRSVSMGADSASDRPPTKLRAPQ